MVVMKGNDKSLQIGAGIFSFLMLAGAVGFGVGTSTNKGGGINASLQTGIITLMYILISALIGYQGAQAKKDKKAKSIALYMTGLLVLLTMFDVAGALRMGQPAEKTKTTNVNALVPENPAAAGGNGAAAGGNGAAAGGNGAAAGGNGAAAAAAAEAAKAEAVRVARNSLEGNNRKGEFNRAYEETSNINAALRAARSLPTRGV